MFTQLILVVFTMLFGIYGKENTSDFISKYKQYNTVCKGMGYEEKNCKGKGVIAFNALLTSDQQRPANKAVIIFKKVTLNSGNAYDATTGKFTAPVDGIYSFTWTIATDAGKYLSTEILMNGKPVSYNHVNGRSGSSNYESGSATANIEMKKNDQVWIRAYEGGGYARYTWSSFSGFQI
ncbi:complement C1q tumor necrosis factor-related protein 2-like [Saccostrea cucullata]|uniref:complement C1q tumor necrosis factor-related protein 2-like n=1 Tax=Saccostrea cuccullata TaxID=36930 RepID=UPI002ECFC8FE